MICCSVGLKLPGSLRVLEFFFKGFLVSFFVGGVFLKIYLYI